MSSGVARGKKTRRDGDAVNLAKRAPTDVQVADQPRFAGGSKGAKRAAIVDAAVELFTMRPYEEVSIDDLAWSADVAHGLISYYFGGKLGLFRAAIAQISDEFVQFQSPTEDEVTPQERIRGYLCRHFQYVRTNPERYALLMPGSYPDSGLQAALAEARNESIARSLGCPTNTPPSLSASIEGWCGFVDGVTRFWMSNTGLDVNEIVDLCIHTLASTVEVASGFRHTGSRMDTALAKTAKASN